MNPGPTGEGATFVSKSEYARLHNWVPSYVTKLVKEGRLVLDESGKRVNVQASDLLLQQSRAVDREGVREHHQRARGESPVQPELPIPTVPEGASATPPPTASSAGGRANDPHYEAYNKARAEREAAQAAMAVMDRRQREGELVEVSQVRAAGEQLASIIAKGFSQIRPRIGAVLGAESDPFKRELLLDAELRKIQEDFANEVLKMFPGTPGA